jgi:AmmeMemoRadiSam system protein B/AmmeMemoRadiSam system protein A
MRIICILLLVFAVLFTPIQSYAANVKDADLAGSWYTASKAELESQLKSYLDAANPPKIDGDIIAVIVPHAGYVYSGPVAAYSYKALVGRSIKTVIIIGFSHRRYFDGIAIYDRGSWRTPLGDIQIDEELAKEIESKNPRIKFNPELFSDENSVEMQVPFIQAALGNIKIVPIAFGTQNYSDAQSLAATLAEIASSRPESGGTRNDVLVVASTDLSHYRSYQDAVNTDNHTVNALSKLKAKEFYDEAKMGSCELCGLMPVTTALLVAQNLGYDKIETLKYANSGDTAGDKGRVVGYLSAVIYKESVVSSRESVVKEKKEQQMLNETQRKRLLQIAREAITSFVRDGKRKTFTEKDAILNKPMGAFVTLHEGGELRGCIGNMVGSGPLHQTVADMAIEAATGDPRFQRLSAKEVDKIKIEISVLSPLKKVKGADEIKIPGDGVIVRRGFSSGVYLPQVATETGWSKEQFLTSLCAHKAGLSADAWKDPATELYTFTAEVFGE